MTVTIPGNRTKNKTFLASIALKQASKRKEKCTIQTLKVYSKEWFCRAVLIMQWNTKKQRLAYSCKYNAWRCLISCPFIRQWWDGVLPYRLCRWQLADIEVAVLKTDLPQRSERLNWGNRRRCDTSVDTTYLFLLDSNGEFGHLIFSIAHTSRLLSLQVNFQS